MSLKAGDKKRLYKQGCKANGMHHSECDGTANSIHHVRPLSYYGSNDESNLLPVNRLCHDLIHAPENESKAVKLGLLILDLDIDAALSTDLAIIKRHRDEIQAAKERLRDSLR